MSARGRDEYRRSLFDKHGPEAADHMRAVSSLIIPVVAGAFIGGALAAQKGYSALAVVLSAIAGSVLFGTWWWFFVTRLSYGAGQPRLRAAELYAKSELRERAEKLYRSVQRLPLLMAKDEVFASNRLVDLYLAWPGHETKGLRELRRLIDTYPETDAAERARAGLVNLKSQLGVAE